MFTPSLSAHPDGLAVLQLKYATNTDVLMYARTSSTCTIKLAIDAHEMTRCHLIPLILSMLWLYTELISTLDR
jgi:hypothetical protein